MVKFTLRGQKRLYQALSLAIDYQESLIGAHQIELYRDKQTGMIERRIPKEFKKDTDVWKRDIIAFKKLQAKILGDIYGE